MEQAKHDRRSQRTRQLLSDALVALILEKRYDAITVQDILDRANVGHSTFYTHFYDKDDLLLSDLDALLARLHQVIDDGSHGPSVLVPSLALFRHVHEERARRGKPSKTAKAVSPCA